MNKSSRLLVTMLISQLLIPLVFADKPGEKELYVTKFKPNKSANEIIIKFYSTDGTDRPSVIKTYTAGENNRLKLIEVIETDVLVNTDNIDFKDMNFDAFDDLLIKYNEGASGNENYACWLFDPLTNKLKFSEIITELCSPEADYNKRTITSYCKSGGCNGETKIFKFFNGNFLLIAEDIYECDGERTTKIVKRRVHGKMKIVKRVKLPGVYENE